MDYLSVFRFGADVELNHRSVTGEYFDGLIEAALPLHPAWEANTFHKALLRHQLPLKQRHHLVHELVQRHTRCE